MVYIYIYICGMGNRVGGGTANGELGGMKMYLYSYVLYL